jgi:hypothetical protein
VTEVPEGFRARLEAAELVCALVGWIPSPDPADDRSKALYMLWHRWTQVSGNDGTPAANPGLTGGVIADLARQRDREHGQMITILAGVPLDQVPPGPADPRFDPCGTGPVQEPGAG